MICGLFSSFDPGILPENLQYSSLINYKWLLLGCIPLFLSWQVFSLLASKDVFVKSLMSFVLSSVKDSSSNPKSVMLVLFSLFFVVFSMNLWGLTPLFFSISSHLSVNLSLSLTLWGGGVLYSICCSFNHLLSHVVPLGSPSFLWPLLVVVETISIFIRPFTLSIRLMANVMAGHLIMSLMGQFFSLTESLLSVSFAVLGFFLMFEMCISGVQAYVFMNLLSLYWKESEDH